MVYLRYIQIQKWWKGMTHVYLIQQNKYTICINKRVPVILKKAPYRNRKLSYEMFDCFGNF